MMQSDNSKSLASNIAALQLSTQNQQQTNHNTNMPFTWFGYEEEDGRSQFIDIRVREYPSYFLRDNVCALCQAHVVGKRDQDTHETLPQHKRALQELLRRTRRFLQVRDAARNLPEQMDEQLSPHGPWQGKIYEIIGRTAMDADPATSVIQDAHKLLRQYQHWERISLLELAVWKFACLNSMDDENGNTSFLEWSRWYASGWKQHKKRHYRCDQVVIVMKAIVPFLQPDETNHHEQEDSDELENLEPPENHELDSADDLDRTTESDRTEDSKSDDDDDDDD